MVTGIFLHHGYTTESMALSRGNARSTVSVIFVLIYFLVLVFVFIIRIFFSFSFVLGFIFSSLL